MVTNVDDIVALELESALVDKYERLQATMAAMQRVVVAYSGGVDSTLVAKVALDTLGRDHMLAVMAISSSLSQTEYRGALTLLDDIGIPYQTVESNEVDDPRYAANQADRCYFCKVHVGDALLEVAAQRGFQVVVDGFNRDDVGDHRPGQRAGRERGVRSPLYEAGLNKNEVRTLAHHLGLPNWNKPALACLSSRVAYGLHITPEVLRRIDQAETALRQMGFSILRVRHHDKLARIEVPCDAFEAIMTQREAIIGAAREAGYVYVTLDLVGFRSGSMNEALHERG